LKGILKATCENSLLASLFLEEEQTTQQLNATVGCMSLLMKHDAVSYHCGGHCLLYCCSLCLTKADGKPSLINGGCPFFHQFKKTGDSCLDFGSQFGGEDVSTAELH